jgi:hypothetical protein
MYVETVRPMGQIVEDLVICMEQIIVDICEEIGVLEIEEHSQIDKNAARHPPFSATGPFGTIYRLCRKKVEDCGKEQHQHEQTACLVIEEQAGGKKEGVAHQPSVADRAEQCEHNQEKDPEIELREEQRLRLMERKNRLQV